MAATTDCPVNGTQNLWTAKMNSWCGSNSSVICTNALGGQLFQIAIGNVSVVAGQSSTTVTASSTSATSNATSNTTSNTDGLVPRAVPIGVGVGIGIPLALLSALFGILFLRERRKRIAAKVVVTSGGELQAETRSPVELSGGGKERQTILST